MGALHPKLLNDRNVAIGVCQLDSVPLPPDMNSWQFASGANSDQTT